MGRPHGGAARHWTAYDRRGSRVIPAADAGPFLSPDPTATLPGHSPHQVIRHRIIRIGIVLWIPLRRWHIEDQHAARVAPGDFLGSHRRHQLVGLIAWPTRPAPFLSLAHLARLEAFAGACFLRNTISTTAIITIATIATSTTSGSDMILTQRNPPSTNRSRMIAVNKISKLA